jgi:glycosyltransferase involved in cell wall biosynthesis
VPAGPAGAVPLVSTIVTFYNQAGFVRETLESALAQDYPRHEVIAVDDGSTDHTPQACLAFDNRIQYLRQANAGVSAARNAGGRHASGELLAFLDGDDLWAPTKLSRQVEAALRHPESGVIVCDGFKFDDAGMLARTLYYGVVQRRFQQSGPELTFTCHEAMVDANLIQTPSQVLVPAAVFSRLGPWDERIRISSDYEFFLRVAGAGYPFTFLSERLTQYRAVATSQSGPEGRRGFVWGLDTFAVMRAHRARVGIEHQRRIARRLEGLTRQLTQDAYYRGRRTDPDWARRYLLRLAIRGRRPHLVVPYLAVVWAPPRLVEAVARLLHRPERAPRPRPRPLT